MGADLIAICAVHPNGSITKEERSRTTRYLKKLCRQAMKYNPEDYGKRKKSLAEIDSVIQNILYIVSDEDIQQEDIKVALDEIIYHTKAPENLVEFWGYRDVAMRSWNNVLIFYAGGMSWGDEPDGLGYQALKWLFLLEADKKLGLE